MKKVVLCQHYFNEIGGIETFIINFCKTFSEEYDITLLCKTISKENALLLSKYANIVCEPTEIECDICIITSVIIDKEMVAKVKYTTIYQMIHSDWSEMKKFWNIDYDPAYKIDDKAKFISVSEHVRKTFLKEYGIDSIVIPNILLKEEKPKRTLKLLSLTRLTKEKGYSRMKKLCDLLEQYEIPYVWNVYGTNCYSESDYKNMILNKPTKRSKELILSTDYVVQLSDTESFCYTMYESLSLGVPVLVTPFPNAQETIINGENGYILPFDMNISSELINKIYENIPTDVKYEQEGVKELWKGILK